MQLRLSAVAAIAAAVLFFVLGFAYGNLTGLERTFELEKWQTLVAAGIAIAIGLLAFYGVQRTQRITVMTKEQERIEAKLPGLHQCHDVLHVVLSNLYSLNRNTRPHANDFLKASFPIEDTGDSFEDAIVRKIPLADEHLKREVVYAVWSVQQQALTMEAGQTEVERTQENLRNLHTFAPEAYDDVREEAERIRQSAEREDAEMVKRIAGLNRFDDLLVKRIAGETLNAN
jgi:hypothetical protein